MSDYYRDHPRVCGEHNIASTQALRMSGSSPRMRGTPSGALATGSCIGIIPAYAGNTCRSARSRSKARDHPRVCGEHYNEAGASTTVPGSSPRMRGTLPESAQALLLSRIIPAYAGNTAFPHASRPYSWDHPRVCGEHSSWMFNCVVLAGSSPRMRGTLRRF